VRKDGNISLLEYRPQLIQQIAKIMAFEGPIHIDLVAKRLASAWGIQRATRATNSAVWQGALKAEKEGALCANIV
jgi:hypothetical protein